MHGSLGWSLFNNQDYDYITYTCKFTFIVHQLGKKEKGKKENGKKEKGKKEREKEEP